MSAWANKVIAVDLYRQIRGRANPQLSKALRATAGVMKGLIPPHVLAEARRLLSEDAAALSEEPGPELESLEDEGAPAGEYLNRDPK
jgi:hypothetical protein